MNELKSWEKSRNKKRLPCVAYALAGGRAQLPTITSRRCASTLHEYTPTAHLRPSKNGNERAAQRQLAASSVDQRFVRDGPVTRSCRNEQVLRPPRLDWTYPNCVRPAATGSVLLPRQRPRAGPSRLCFPCFALDFATRTLRIWCFAARSGLVFLGAEVS